jgi:hypothetical protein
MIKLTINGEQKSFDAPPDMPLLWVLRDVLGITGDFPIRPDQPGLDGWMRHSPPSWPRTNLTSVVGAPSVIEAAGATDVFAQTVALAVDAPVLFEAMME